MSRNSMHSFGLNPKVSIPRSRFDLNCNIKFTGNTGDLIPFYVTEVLPGDTFEVKTSMVCRLQTLIHPIMDTMYLDTYYFYVPNRLVWDHWKNFCGEPDKAWLPETEYTIPKIDTYLSDYIDTTGETPEFDFEKFAGDFKDTIFDYLGMPCSPTMNTVANDYVSGDRGYKVNALPCRAYNKIYDDWFRDENLIDPINLYTGDNDVKWDPDDPLTGGKCYKASKYHDYFTSSLPQAQRGNPVSLTANAPDSLRAFPVYTASIDHELNKLEANDYGLHFGNITGGQDRGIGIASISSNPVYKGTDIPESVFAPYNLWAHWNPTNLPLGITINDLRLAFQVQKFMEKSARGGARYIELLKEMFGVTSPDARLQRSEYLGGHRIPITIHQIVNQTETIDTPLGNTGAMSLTSDNHQDFVHSFTEHGYVIGICVARYKHSYSQGYYPMFDRTTKFDFYWPVFANIGEQPIKNRTICYDFQNNDKVFGYQEAWAEYRTMFDRVAGEMRPGIPNTLASWHLGDYYDELPTLSKGWIEEDIAPVDRAIAVTSSVSDQFLFDFYVQNRATRPMPVYSIPGLADHH